MTVFHQNSRFLIARIQVRPIRCATLTNWIYIVRTVQQSKMLAYSIPNVGWVTHLQDPPQPFPQYISETSTCGYVADPWLFTADTEIFVGVPMVIPPFSSNVFPFCFATNDEIVTEGLSTKTALTCEHWNPKKSDRLAFRKFGRPALRTVYFIVCAFNLRCSHPHTEKYYTKPFSFRIL